MRDYKKLLEESDSFYYGRIEIGSVYGLKKFLEENKSWILEMMSWEEKDESNKKVWELDDEN
jgi:hypothetical protein